MQKVVLITGATSGIGRAAAELLTSEGYKVYGTARHIEGKETGFELIAMDVRDTGSVQRAVAAIVEREGRIDVLVNNAGVGATGAVEELSAQELEGVFATNVFGAVAVMQAVLPTMRAQGSGLIINITSIAGYMGLPFRGAYSASKGALMLLSESVRMEVQPFGVEVTTIAPGDFATDIASRRLYTPVKEDSPYAEVYAQQLKTMDTHVDNGGDPKDMARRILAVIRTKHPRVHYKEAKPLEQFSIVLKRLLPSKWYEAMLRKFYSV